MNKHTVLVPLIFLIIVLLVGFFFYDGMGIKTNIFHDAIGGNILARNKVDFEKIIKTFGDDVLFCDQDNSLYYFHFQRKEVSLHEADSNRCDFLGNGTGKIFADLTKVLSQEEDKRSN